MAASSTPPTTPTPEPTGPPTPPGTFISRRATYYIEDPTISRNLVSASMTNVPWETLANLKVLLPADISGRIVIAGWDGVVAILREVEALAIVLKRRGL